MQWLTDLLKPYLAALVGFLAGIRREQIDREVEEVNAKYLANKQRQQIDADVARLNGLDVREQLQQDWTERRSTVRGVPPDTGKR